MTDHLPECPHANSRTATFYGGYCVCPLLRACEERVRDELFPLRWSRAEQLEEARVNGWHSGWNAAIEDGYNAGVQAARDAVAAVGVLKDTSHDMRVQALAAIDALRDDPPSLPPTKGRAHKY